MFPLNSENLWLNGLKGLVITYCQSLTLTDLVAQTGTRVLSFRNSL